ncbi:hypothetical protein [Streptosporangium sp. NPDC023615]|uniref:hypothetical protein n=1 Tax=Streptosporangium sp. NPDC023615 TaxID=3154794 RepID=UPI00341A6481
MNTRQATIDSPAARPPWAGITVSALSLLAMVAIAWAVWDSLPEFVTTREATATRSGIEVPRLVLAAALPATLVVIGVVMTGSTLLGSRLRHRLDPMLVATPSAQTRSMNVLFVVLPLLLLVLQAGLLLRTAGREFPMEQAVAVAFGVLLIGLGNILPKIAPSRIPGGGGGRLVLAWQRSQRAGGTAMVVLGIACAVTAFFFPPILVAVVSAFLIAAVYLLMVVLTVTRLR